MSDPRLLAWLAATREALDAAAAGGKPDLEGLGERRDALAAALREQGLDAQVPDSLARQLTRAEAELTELLGSLRGVARDRLEELRRVRTAAGGYRPAQPNHPAFVSKTI